MKRAPRSAIVAALAALVVLVPYTSSSAAASGVAVDVTRAAGDQSEPFIAVAPHNPSRIVVTGIDFTSDGRQGPGRNIYVAVDGGRRWKGTTSPISGDLTAVADDEGTFWVLGLTNSAAESSPGVAIDLVRIPPRGASPAATNPIPGSLTGLGRDKPSIAIDNSASSPTYGRLYAIWSELGSTGYQGAFATYCDTRTAKRYAPARCDAQTNWAMPFQLLPASGTIWDPQIATGPNGEVYVVWMDSTYTVRGTSCPAACTGTASFTSTRLIASTYPGDSCAPAGSRVRESPTIAVDTSHGPNRGRVYVTWTDVSFQELDPRCEWLMTGPWDAYIASAPGRLPDSSQSTRLYVDGTRDAEGRRGAAVSDEFYATVAVDGRTGRAWVSFYSTRLDASRRSTNVYVRSLNTGRLGPLTRVSGRIDLTHANDGGFAYGDYAGLAVVGGRPYPVWVGNGIGKDVYTSVPR